MQCSLLNTRKNVSRISKQWEWNKKDQFFRAALLKNKSSREISTGVTYKNTKKGELLLPYTGRFRRRFKFAPYLVSGTIHSTRWQRPNRSSSLKTTSSSTSQSRHYWHAQEWPVTGPTPEGSGTMTRKTFLSGLMKRTTLVWSPCRLEAIWLLCLNDFVLALIRCGNYSFLLLNV